MLGQSSYENHNDNSHQGSGDWEGRYTAANEYCMQQLSNLAQRLHMEEDPTGGTLLDSTIIYASSDCGVGWTHSINRQPIILIGSGRGKLKNPGIHYQAVASSNLGAGNPNASGNTSDVLLSVLQCFDPTATQIGDLSGNSPPGSTTPLTDIRA
jgi:hypothetical protein